MNFRDLIGFEWDEGNLEKVLQRMEPQIAEMAFQGDEKKFEEKREDDGTSHS